MAIHGNNIHWFAFLLSLIKVYGFPPFSHCRNARTFFRFIMHRVLNYGEAQLPLLFFL